MSMSPDDMKLHDPDVPWQVKLTIRLKRFWRFGVGIFAGTIVIFLTVILALIVIYWPVLLM